MGQRTSDVFGGKKNRGADDATHQQQDGVEQAESADETRLFAGIFSQSRGNGSRGHLHYPIPSSSGDSSGVPQRRQITAEQSPQVSGSSTSLAQTGQYRLSAGFGVAGELCWLESMREKL